MQLENTLGRIDANADNLRHGRLPRLRIRRPQSWHTDAVGGRPPQQRMVRDAAARLLTMRFCPHPEEAVKRPSRRMGPGSALAHALAWPGHDRSILHQCGTRPPSTLNACPETLRAPGEARNTTVSAMSSGSLARRSGTAAAARCSASSMVWPSFSATVRMRSMYMAVRTMPGHTALTLILCRPSCCAAVLVRLITAPLLAA